MRIDRLTFRGWDLRKSKHVPWMLLVYFKEPVESLTSVEQHWSASLEMLAHPKYSHPSERMREVLSFRVRNGRTLTRIGLRSDPIRGLGVFRA